MPTLDEFIEYAKKNGCKEGDKEVVLVGPRGPTSVRYLVRPDGAFAVLPEMNGDEHLTPTMTGSLCRQLQIPALFPGFGDEPR